MMALDRSQPGHGHGCGGHAHEARPRGRPGGREGPPSPTRKPGAVDPAVLGLLVHCAADGLALGAAALSGNTQLSLIVSVAMLAHKVCGVWEAKSGTGLSLRVGTQTHPAPSTPS